MARELTMPDGRTLEVHELGDPHGFPIVTQGTSRYSSVV